MSTSPLRIGEGWDTHALVLNRPLILGGIQIPHSHGLLGHSDADALCHAIIDALLGAAALGDIGQHFSDLDAKHKGANSITLLEQTVALIQFHGYEIINIDSTIIAQAPKLASHIPFMRSRLAKALNITENQINVKAKTAEKMGPVGRGESIETRAICLIQK
jgi:2-C-methyl-D-erythritol 2,4-cyclodiphosphate synthase